MLTHEDKELLAKKGISEEKIAEQLACFEKGFPFLKLSAAASVENGGIMKAEAKDFERYLAAWNAYKDGEKKIVKFVPASGAASRMFKNMFEFLGADYDKPTTDFEKKFFDHIHDFAFYNDLNAACMDNTGKNIDALLSEQNYKAIVSNLLEAAGLNYGALPKGLLKFHRYADGVRTPLEEHLVEGALYAAGKTGKVNIHFTVSTEHRALFEKLVAAKVGEYEAKYGAKYHISFSEQKPSTDTVAADMENKPFRDKDGKLLFRPGGHGALIENLNDLDADIVFIKNIDNVTTDARRGDTVLYKKVLAGLLLELQQETFAHLRALDAGTADLTAVAGFIEQRLCVKLPAEYDAALLRAVLDRPIRLCGMVRNEGEPGGGPFWVGNPDGTQSLQIAESSQISPDDMPLMKQATHFNPVDLVCGVRNVSGGKFDLRRYTDPSTGFISSKSSGGRPLRAQELPGLWNGAMARWNTIFVDVPITTFSPVKVVQDLLRPQHQQ